MNYEYNHSRFPLTVAGTLILTLVYSIWLIEVIPFSLFDDGVMWGYGWYLNWLEVGELNKFAAFAIEATFVYVKYLFLPHIVASWSLSNS